MLLDHVRRWWRRQPAPTPCPAPALTVVPAPTPARRKPVRTAEPPPSPARRRRTIEEIHRTAVLAEAGAGRAGPFRPLLLDPTEHARRLIRWCQRLDLGARREILATDLMECHLEMCAEEGLAVRAWNPVSREVTRLTTGRKDYRWVHLPDGAHRLRVFVIPPAPAGTDSVTQMRRAA